MLKCQRQVKAVSELGPTSLRLIPLFFEIKILFHFSLFGIRHIVLIWPVLSFLFVIIDNNNCQRKGIMFLSTMSYFQIYFLIGILIMRNHEQNGIEHISQNYKEHILLGLFMQFYGHIYFLIRTTNFWLGESAPIFDQVLGWDFFEHVGIIHFVRSKDC